jgi:cysteine desulfurase/selenocysteine lyase
LHIDLDDFPKARQVTYLNSASISLMPRPAYESMIEFQRKIASGGTLDFDEEAETKVFENVREEAARMLGARPEDIAVVSGATEGFCAIAWSLKLRPGANIVSTDAEFPSVVYPWIRLGEEKSLEIRLARNHDGVVGEDQLEKLVDDKTAVLSISHVEYGTGQRFNPRRLAELAHSHGALLALDATQSAGLVPLDVCRDGIDVLVSGGYKGLLGPFGAGILYIGPTLNEQLVPSLVGWRSTPNPYELDATRLTFAPGAKRFEYGTMSYASAVGLAESMKYLRKLGYAKTQAHSSSLVREFISMLKEDRKLPAHILLTPEDEEQHASIISVRFKDWNSSTIAGKLVERNIIVSQRFNGIRFSFHIYNSGQDISKAVSTLDNLLQ